MTAIVIEVQVPQKRHHLTSCNWCTVVYYSNPNLQPQTYSYIDSYTFSRFLLHNYN